jgi:hypothetical protein
MGDIFPYGGPKYVTWQLAFTQMLSLGQSQENAAVYAAIGSAESSLDLTVINDTPSTGDYSVGIWQINYYGSLYGSRAAAFGTPQQLIAGGLNKQAQAALNVGRGGFGPWSTYNNGAYKQYLHGYSPPSGAPAGGGVPPTVQLGSTGSYVQQVQRDLNTFGYNLATDGIFGPATQAAVINFQAQHGLAHDGVVGPLTWQALANAVDRAAGGANPGPTTIPTAPAPPSEPPGNADPATVAEWSNLVYAGGPELGTTLANIAAYANSIGGFQ